jgi:hypothetical protein
MQQAVDEQLKELIDNQQASEQALRLQKYEVLKKAKLEAKEILEMPIS